MAHIPFPLSNAPGRVPIEASGRLLNCYAEPLGDAAPKVGATRAVWRRCAGLTQFKSTANSGFRGGILVGSTLYAGWSGAVKKYLSDGSETSVGSLSGTKRLFWARNNKTPTPDLVAVDPDNGAFTVASGSVSSFADSDLPQPNSVCSQDGYLFFTIGDGRVFSTDLNDVSVNSLNFARMEGKADVNLRCIGWAGHLFVFGERHTEVWYDAGNATAFPYSRTTVIQRGLAGRYAVAGQEDGFGVALLWVADDNTVVMLNGYDTTKVSPPDLDRLIQAVTNKDDLEAYVYTEGGHSWWGLSTPSWTWEFNLVSKKWNERQSYGETRWRGTQPVYAFGKWITGDTLTGDLLYVDSTAQTENSDPLVFQIESGPVQGFPYRQFVARADFDFAPGVGIATGFDPIQTDPVVEISYARDGGSNWSLPRICKLGQQDRTKLRVKALRAGLSGVQGHRWRLRISDPVYAGLLGGEQTQELRR